MKVSGHMIHAEYPEEYRAAIEQHLD